MKINEVILFIALLFGTLFIFYSVFGSWRVFVPPAGQACTLEAKICPDGSAVGRTGPNCEFAPCPLPQATSTDQTGEGILPYNSGVEGTVYLGPTCPVVRDPPDPECNDKPYATAILIYRTGATTPFVIGNSNEQGVFRFSLPPGSYTLIAKSGTTLPYCSETSVAVVPDEYTEAFISCDTGIR